jgi:hypothetical protein
MDKKTIIDKILAVPGTSWKEEHRALMMTINEAELAKLLPEDPAQAVQNARKPIVDKLISDTRTIWKEENRAALMACNEAQLTALLPVEASATAIDSKAVLAALDPKARRVIEQGIAANDREKTRIVAALVANKGCKFAKEELEEMDLDFLEKVADSMSVSYRGSAPPRFNDRARGEVDTNADAVPDPPRFLTLPVTAAK